MDIALIMVQNQRMGIRVQIRRGDKVLLERGITVEITDIPEDANERLLIGEDEKGKLHVFPVWEIIE